MDPYSDYANPIGFDQRLIMGKLGYDTPSQIERPNVNDRLKVALVEQELAESRKKIAQLESNNKKETSREHFTVGGNCGCSSEGMKSNKCSCRSNIDPDDNIMGISTKKFLIILVVVMAAFCVIQYFSRQTEMREMMAVLYSVIRASPGTVQVVPANVTAT